MKTLLKREVGIDRSADVPVGVKVDGNTATFDYSVPNLDFDLPNRAGIQKFRFDGTGVRRVAPFAVEIMGFIDEWFDANPIDLARISSPEAMMAQKEIRQWRQHRSEPIVLDSGRRCGGETRHWQVKIGFAESKDFRVFVVSEAGRNRLRMEKVLQTPSDTCEAVSVSELTKQLPE